jgi:hypothetical protein
MAAVRAGRAKPPWWATYPQRYWTPAERAAAIREGWKPPAEERRRDVLEEQRVRVNQHLPWAAPMFTGPAPETREHYEARQRQQRVDKILKKYGIGQPRGPWWRV